MTVSRFLVRYWKPASSQAEPPQSRAWRRMERRRQAQRLRAVPLRRVGASPQHFLRSWEGLQATPTDC